MIRCSLNPIIALLIVLIVASWSFCAKAATGLDIMTEVDAQPAPPIMAADLTMTLLDRNNNQRVRSLRSLSKTFDDADRQRLFFLAPADVRGTGFLVVDYHDTERDDDQWLFLPNLNKSKRIAGSDQSGSFMGSDISYADLASRNLDDWQYELVREDQVDEAAVWIVRASAADQTVIDRTGYTESLLYVQQSNYQVIRAIHTQTGTNQRKLLNIPSWEQRDGYWIPKVMQVVSQEGGQTVHRTQLTFTNIELDIDAADGEFSVQRLEQGL